MSFKYCLWVTFEKQRIFILLPIPINWGPQISDASGDIIFNLLNCRAERELSSRLRREQDEAFQASLEMDRAKARERAATAEAEARLAREAAEAERRKELLARAIARRQRRWAHSLPAEPAPVGSETVCLSIKLPNGSRAQRVFPVTDSIKVFLKLILLVMRSSLCIIWFFVSASILLHNLSGTRTKTFCRGI